ncbi:MAG: type II secretion system protein [Candidatus Microsaccharimonas sp.]
MNTTKQTTKGFTIIEVVLVLAIAGLIFLMVFIALPALQAGQRDTSRKQDVSNVAAAVTRYGANNRGAFPTTAQLQAELGQTGTSPNATFANLSTNTQTVTVGTSVGTQTDATIIVVKGLKCESVAADGAVTTAAGTTRQFVVTTKLEGGGGPGYCLDS